MNWKPFFVVVLSGFLLMSIGGAIHSQEDSKNVPVAVFPEASFDFGSVPEGTQVVHEYKIRNMGSALLKIKRVRAG